MFARNYRLPAIEIPAVFHASKKLRHPVLDIRFRPGEQLRCAVIVSTKVSKLATTRNKIKRLLRMVWYGMTVEETLPHGDYVLIAKAEQLSAMTIPELEELIADVMRQVQS